VALTWTPADNAPLTCILIAPDTHQLRLWYRLGGASDWDSVPGSTGNNATPANAASTRA